MVNEEQKEATESELEELAKYFIKKGKESGLEWETEYDLTFVDDIFSYWTYLRYISPGDNFFIFLMRLYDLRLREIDLPVREYDFVDLPLDDTLLKAIKNKAAPKVEIKKSVIGCLPEPEFLSLEVGIIIYNPDTAWETFIEEGCGEYYSDVAINPLDESFKDHYLSKLTDYKHVKNEEAIRIYEESLKKIYTPIINIYRDKIADINSLKYSRGSIKKIIDLGFEICKDEELEKRLESDL